MKKLVAVFAILLMAFVGLWITKSKTPAQRPDAYENGYVQEEAWWHTSQTNVDEQWILDPEIPSDYLPLPGTDEVYMVVDQNGKIVKYRQRTLQADGSWMWRDVNPDIPDDYEAVDGLTDVYKVTASDGNVSYVRYVRNDDDTYAFVPVDETGKDIEATPTDDTIPTNFVRVEGNTYAIMNDHGVIIGYKERTQKEDGTYLWVETEKPKETQSAESSALDTTLEGSLPSVEMPQVQQGGKTPPNGFGYAVNNNQGTKTENRDGTFSEVTTYTETETSGGYITTYRTTVTKIWDSQGNLISTKKGDREEISRVPLGSSTGQTADKSNVKSTISEELARISVGISYDTALANEILGCLNASRASEGLPALLMDSGNAMNIAKIRAAAAAVYDYADNNSPLYGTLSTMLATYGVTDRGASENIWRTSADKTAEQVNVRFMTIEAAKVACMSSTYTTVGIAVVQRNGYLYVIEVFL